MIAIRSSATGPGAPPAPAPVPTPPDSGDPAPLPPLQPVLEERQQQAMGRLFDLAIAARDLLRQRLILSGESAERADTISDQFLHDHLAALVQAPAGGRVFLG